jgi:hypothetical protein
MLMAPLVVVENLVNSAQVESGVALVVCEELPVFDDELAKMYKMRKNDAGQDETERCRSRKRITTRTTVDAPSRLRKIWHS